MAEDVALNTSRVWHSHDAGSTKSGLLPMTRFPSLQERGNSLLSKRAPAAGPSLCFKILPFSSLCTFVGKKRTGACDQRMLRPACRMMPASVAVVPMLSARQNRGLTAALQSVEGVKQALNTFREIKTTGWQEIRRGN